MKYGLLLLVAGLMLSCHDSTEPTVHAIGVDFAPSAVDTLGVTDIAQGDTLIDTQNFTIIENTWLIPRSSEIFAWECYAERIRPVKLIVMRFDAERDRLEMIGESRLALPRKVGPNRFQLHEPIPVRPGDLYGLMQPEETAVPFAKIQNWRALGTVHPIERPFTSRDRFSNYGWRFSLRIFLYSPED